MGDNNLRSVCGVFFTGKFCSELGRYFDQLGDEKVTTVVDIQRARFTLFGEPSENRWTIYFITREIVPPEEVILVAGFPVHILAADLERLRGKTLDFENFALVVK